MLIFLYSIVAASALTATGIIWMLATGRATHDTKITLPRRRRDRTARPTQTREGYAARYSASATSSTVIPGRRTTAH